MCSGIPLKDGHPFIWSPQPQAIRVPSPPQPLLLLSGQKQVKQSLRAVMKKKISHLKTTSNFAKAVKVILSDVIFSKLYQITRKFDKFIIKYTNF